VLLLLSRRFQKVCSRNEKGGSEAVWLQDFINRQQLRIAGYSNTQLLQLARTCAGVQPARQLALQLAQPLLRSLDKQPACFTDEHDFDVLTQLCRSVAPQLTVHQAGQVFSAIDGEHCLRHLQQVPQVVAAVSIMGAWQAGQSSYCKPPDRFFERFNAANVFLQRHAE
jgi:hypothetical protein